MRSKMLFDGSEPLKTIRITPKLARNSSLPSPLQHLRVGQTGAAVVKQRSSTCTPAVLAAGGVLRWHRRTSGLSTQKNPIS
jgi:hypothetical protein